MSPKSNFLTRESKKHVNFQFQDKMDDTRNEPRGSEAQQCDGEDWARENIVRDAARKLASRTKV